MRTHSVWFCDLDANKEHQTVQFAKVLTGVCIAVSDRYVSRYHVKDSARHVILGTQQFKPNEFASQINLSMENAWGILRCVIDICRKLDEGKYLILKDPNKVSVAVSARALCRKDS